MVNVTRFTLSTIDTAPLDLINFEGDGARIPKIAKEDQEWWQS